MYATGGGISKLKRYKRMPLAVKIVTVYPTSLRRFLK